jgi:hypothetical protein
MVNVKDWLKLFRSNTAPWTVLRVEFFYLLAGAPFLSFYNGAVVLWATLIHWLAFGHNTVMDTARGFDKENPHRKHDPLISGSLQLNSAHNVVHWLEILATLAGLSLVALSSGQQVAALAFLLLFAISGHAYNDGLDRSTIFGFIPYTISYTSLCAASYFLHATTITPLFLIAILYIILVEIFEIGWENHLKDITVEKEPNLLRTLGVKVEKSKFKCSMKGRLFAYIIKIGSFIPLFLTGLINITLSVVGVSVLALLMLDMVFAVLLVENREYNHDRDLNFSLVVDLASLLLLPLVFVDVIGAAAAASMIVYAIAWFIIFNYFLWDSIYEPKD